MKDEEKAIFIFLLIVISFHCTSMSGSTHEVLSPDGKIAIAIHWENPFGKNRDVHDHYNELKLAPSGGSVPIFLPS